MSNIERKYSYHDDGVLPSEGEYGVTYLTLYSSGAGNVYDGWLWDPDRRNYSETERTFGYRNPEYEDYCWDDEVVVDLSNAQARQETSDFAQGRITSFNTNVSNVPIVLQDVDITGLDEEEREAKATTVLFSKIPLVKDAYIQAAVEVQCKVNISPDNTNGMVRVEAFYILNDESDRTMRPNPVHTFAVSTANERHTLPWLYWNPALKHEDNNYIGVKLLCTGGTAEIGISDNPEYGDAMITLTSAGLTGDHIDSGYPVALEIFGKEQVPAGYKLKEEDYTVLCTYDTGEVYEVTRLCTFNPAMGEKVIDPVTTLTATYQGLQASMTLYLALVESIELIGLTDFYEDTYTFSLDDFVVLAHYDTGDVMDISDDEELVYDPPMGTTINDNTVLTATYAPEYMPSSEFEDSLEIVKHSIRARGTSSGGGLIYTLYDDKLIEITGNATHVDSTLNARYINEFIEYPDEIKTAITDDSLYNCRLKWAAEGNISGLYLPAVSYAGNTCYGSVGEFIDFSNITIEPYYSQLPASHGMQSNPIVMYFDHQNLINSENISFLNNINYKDVRGLQPIITSSKSNLGSGNTGTLESCFNFCQALYNVDCISNWDVSKVTSMYRTFKDSYIFNVEGLSDWNVSSVATMYETFYGCRYLVSVDPISNWDVSAVTTMYAMFQECTELDSAEALRNWDAKILSSTASMFWNSGLETLEGLGTMMLNAGSDIQGMSISATSMFTLTKFETLEGLEPDVFSNGKYSPEMMFQGTSLKSLRGSVALVLTNATSLNGMFWGSRLEDISDCSTWNTSNVTNFDRVFQSNINLGNIDAVSNWDLSNASTAKMMFSVPGRNNTIVYTMDQINNYSCNSNLFSNYTNVLGDAKIFYLTDHQSVKYLRIRSVNIDGQDTRKHYYIAYTGMFEGRDIFELVETGYQTYTYYPVFVNPDATPAWYRSRIEDYIRTNHFERTT